MTCTLWILFLLSVSRIIWAVKFRVNQATVNEDFVHLIGRFDHKNITGLFQSQWPGSGLALKVVAGVGSSLANESGVQVTVLIGFEECVDPNCNFVVQTKINGDTYSLNQVSSPFYSKYLRRTNNKVNVDGSVSLATARTVGQNVINMTISDAKPGSIHEFSFFKRTESYCGDVGGILVIGDITVIGGEVLPYHGNTDYSLSTSTHSTKTKPKILFLGDSITAGFGVEGTSPCDFSSTTESVLEAYAWQVAEAVVAEAHVVAWSGLGVVRDYGDPNEVSRESMPTFYNRTIGTEAGSYWDPSQWQPNLVVIALGTNDFSSDPAPTVEEFAKGYLNWIDIIMRDYPTAQLLLLCNPVMDDNYDKDRQCDNIENVRMLASAQHGIDVHYLRIPQSVADPSGNWGCGGHPNVVTSTNMAAYMLPMVKKILGIAA